jgi:putative membrane-bound dehydrogenase-like protein
MAPRARKVAFGLVLLMLAASVVPPGTADDRPGATKEPAVRFPSGRECAARMTVPEGFEVTLFAGEPDVVNPIGIDFDHRGRVFVLEALEYPRKAPAGAKGHDRIKILEDTDGDGIADKVTVFADGLNLASGIAVGHGGVFVGQAPHLLFLEDTDGDDKADKRTILLDGWGYQDTHETLNSFLWGPDGWLYGCHGVFTFSKIQNVPFSAAIWRYHPITKKFEIFAEGTSNPWGFDYDESGSGFLTACVIPHLFHVVPGGLYLRQAGQNHNPYAFGEIKEICDHLHWRPGAYRGDVKADTTGGGHAHAGCLIYQGGAYPPAYHGRVFMSNIHGSRINTDILKRNGSTYVGSHGPDFLLANDPNFRAIQLRTGPDGSIYILDWYDPQVCHNTDPAVWDKTHGRIYKVTYKGTKQPKVGDLTKRSGAELVELLRDKNSWWWRQALLVLQERRDQSVAPKLKELVRHGTDYHHGLRALWALYDVGAFDEDFGRETLGHKEPWLRAWAVRLLGQLDTKPAPATWKALLELAARDSSPDVRLQLASSCQRWNGRLDTSELLQALMLRDEDAHDPVIPFLTWVAYEPNLVAHATDRLDWLATHAENPIVATAIAPRALRRLVATNDPKHFNAAIVFPGRLKGPISQGASLDGLLEALRGRRMEPPAAWAAVARHLMEAKDEGVQRRTRRLGIHFSDREAVAQAEKEAVNAKAELGRRIEAVQGLGLARLSSSEGPLLQLATSEAPVELKREVLRALSGFDGERIAPTLLAEWKRWPPALRTEVIGLLTGRKPWARHLLEAVVKGALDPKDLTENDVRRILALKDAELTKKVEAVWGKLREQTPEKLEAQLVKFRKQLAEQPGDRKAGKAVFEKNCQVCHKLNGQGHEVGPDLTGANRRDVEYLLINILDPNRVVGKDYYAATVTDKSGRVHTGLLAENVPGRVVLKGENAKLTVIPRNEIEEFTITEKSLMPEGLPDTMTEVQFRDLIAYLMEDPFLTRGVVAGPFVASPPLDFQFPIEKAADPLRTEGVRWKAFRIGPAGTIDLGRLGALAPSAGSVAFVAFDVRSPRALKTVLDFASDGGAKVWVNGKEVFRGEHTRNGQRVSIELKEGTNRLLFKLPNLYPPSWLRARLIDPERQLEEVPIQLP